MSKVSILAKIAPSASMEYHFWYFLCRFPYKDRYLEETHVHPDYQCKTFAYDITLLKVEPIIDSNGDFPKHISPIALPCIKKMNKNKNKNKRRKKLSGRTSRSHQKLNSRRASQRGGKKRRYKRKTKRKSILGKREGRCGSQNLFKEKIPKIGPCES